MRVFTYYDEIDFPNQESIISLWSESWKKQGFEPVVLDRTNAKQHPFYNEYVTKLNELHVKLLDKPLKKYGLCCYLRWLAYATQTDEVFYVSDYDVINNSFKPTSPSNYLHFMDYDCPCIVSGTPKQFETLCHAFIDITQERLEEIKSFIKNYPINHYHDLEFLTINFEGSSANCMIESPIRKKYKVKMTRDSKTFLAPFNVNDTDLLNSFELIHFSYGFCSNVKTPKGLSGHVERTEVMKNVCKTHLNLEIPSLIPTKIYTYYERINFGGQTELIDLWKKSWERQGFEPIVLNETHAEQHFYYEEFIIKIKELHLNLMGAPLSRYGLSCYLRWLAYAAQTDEAFYVSDYDVINNSFKPQEISNKLHLMDDCCPCIVSGTPKQFDLLCHAFIDITHERLQEIKYHLEKDKEFVQYHDQEFFLLNFVEFYNPNCDIVLKKLNAKLSRDRNKLNGALTDIKDKSNLKNFELLHFSHTFCEKNFNTNDHDLRTKITKELCKEYLNL